MMVTFVSQCEKNALKRTRRVLDAFANRIGDNTWQTVITQEGLLAVKKLLRKTASKSTAVSCHWIRSRSRSELVWVVGSRGRFSSSGLVAVNTTSKEVPMDIIINKPIKGVMYANTQLQRLDQHLFAVGYIAEKLYAKFYPDEAPMCTAAFITGCLHDIGKIDPQFQKWVIKDKNKGYEAEDGQHINEAAFSFEKHPRHNEISVLLYALLDDPSFKIPNRDIKKRIKHAIYWHHAKPFRPKGGFESLGDVYKKLNSSLKGEAGLLVLDRVSELINKVFNLDVSYRNLDTSCLRKCLLPGIDHDKIYDIEDMRLPKYKEYDSNETIVEFKTQAKSNAINSQLRACLITADRWVSSMLADELSLSIKERLLDEFFNDKFEENRLVPESSISMHIDHCLSEFPDDERSKQQSDVAKKLADNFDHITVLAGAAGCGKTKIALEWAKLRNAQQIFWICPRVQICQGLFAELRECDNPYLPDASVEIHTGEFKCTNSYSNITPEDDYLTGDIVITTIDQLLGSVISHSKADRLLNYLGVHVVFDEYHEYINMPGFNLLFSELLASRESLSEGVNTLLVSATPHYHYLNTMIGIDQDYDLVEMPSFNKCHYQFQFVEYDEADTSAANPLYCQQPENTFVISNTAITAQKSFIQNQHSENAILLHSKYKKSDKKALFQQVFDSFSKEGNQLNSLLRSGPIVQASLNISCDHMVSEITHAENCLQRLGRLDRFGRNFDVINQYKLAVPLTMSSGGSLSRFLSSSNQLASTKAWLAYLQEATEYGDKVLDLLAIYKIYKSFYEDTNSLNFIESDLVAALKKSAMLISDRIAEPQTIAPSKKNPSKRTKISKSLLRGDSRFVQMAVCDVSDLNHIVIENHYAYDIPANENEEVDNLTESLERLRNYGLLDYLAQKHGRIDESSPVNGIPASKMSARKSVLEGYAREADYPLFLSYTPNTLDERLGECTAHPEAIYYAISNKQPIGSISLKHLLQQKD
ncbi:MAG: CRISPR-associated endonuclease Cas3'' [Paraglaciecola chathamensis]